MQKLSALILTTIMMFTALQSSAQKTLTAQQLMVVVTDGWNALQGHLYAFEKQNDKWAPQFNNPVVVGAKGLGIGDGIEPIAITDAPVKKEGDLKAPAGFFTIGTAFGYADAKAAGWIKNRYIKATDTLICVDDMRSAYYNTLVNNDTAKSDYRSFENMHRKDDFYKWGLFINHNSGNTVPGNGSCIFMHIWKNNEHGTEGCTAMPESDLLQVLHWIDAGKSPLLVQLPKEEYDKLKADYGLPELKP